MSRIANFVSLHPYFKVHAGKLEAAKALLPQFQEKANTEAKMLYYEFTLNGDEVYCREGYTDADGVLVHLENVGALLGEMVKVADVMRVEVHGPAAELDKLRAPLAQLNPTWFVLQ